MWGRANINFNYDIRRKKVRWYNSYNFKLINVPCQACGPAEPADARGARRAQGPASWAKPYQKLSEYNWVKLKNIPGYGIGNKIRLSSILVWIKNEKLEIELRFGIGIRNWHNHGLTHTSAVYLWSRALVRVEGHGKRWNMSSN